MPMATANKRPRRSWCLPAAAVLALAASACGTGPVVGPGDVPLPVHRDLAAAPLAELRGSLTKVGDCLYVNQDGPLVLPIWPADAWLDGDTLRRGDAAVARLGDAVRFDGGFLPYDALRLAMDEHVPPDCRIGTYFLVSGNAEPCEPTLVPDTNGSKRLECATAQRSPALPNANRPSLRGLGTRLTEGMT